MHPHSARPPRAEAIPGVSAGGLAYCGRSGPGEKSMVLRKDNPQIPAATPKKKNQTRDARAEEGRGSEGHHASRRLVHPRVRCRCRRYRMEIDVLHHFLECVKKCVFWRMRLCQRRRRRRLVCMFSSAEWTHSGPAVRTVDNYYAICGMHRYRTCARSNSRVCCCLGYVFLCKCSELSISALQRRCTDDNNPLMWCYG